MTLIIDIPRELEQRLESAARKEGATPADLAQRLLAENLPPAERSPSDETPNASTIAMIDRWLEEDATDDPEEIAQAEADLRALMEALNQNRAAGGQRLLFP